MLDTTSRSGVVSEQCSRQSQVLNAHATALLVASAYIVGGDGATACSCRRFNVDQLDFTDLMNGILCFA